MAARHQPPRVLIGVGFVMLLLTSLQGWGMVGVIVIDDAQHAALLQELKRLHNLGLTGGLLAVGIGMALSVLSIDPQATRRIYRVMLPSLLMAPIAFADRVSSITLGALPVAVQGVFFGVQALSALGITLGLLYLVLAIFFPRERTDAQP